MNLRTPGRFEGLDLARFLALLGMMGTHLWFFDAAGDTPPPVGAVSGKAAALFAVLAGAGVVLTSRRALAGGEPGRAARNLTGRGLALLAIGLSLGLFQPLVLVILGYYGVMFLLAIPLLRAGPRALLAAALAWALVWPLCSHLLRAAFRLDAPAASPDWTWLADPLGLALDLLLTGAYPALSWMSYLALGMAIGKALPPPGAEAGKAGGTGRLGGLLLSAGAAAAAAAALFGVLCARLAAGPLAADLGFRDGRGEQIAREELAANAHGVASSESPWYLLSTGPHTGAPLDLLITGGTAAAVIGACLLAAGRLGPRARRLLAPALGAGAAPLTVYTAHVLGVVAVDLSAGAPVFSIDGGLPWWFSSPQLWALHAAGALAIGLLLRLTGRRGPLEAFVSACGRLLAGAGRRDGASAQPAEA